MRIFYLFILFTIFSCSHTNLTSRSVASSELRCVATLGKILKTAKFVRNFDDFFNHTKLHVERVKRMGMWFYIHNRNEFPDVNDGLVEEFLALHDKGKLVFTLSQLSEDDKPVLRRLYSFFGRKNDLSLEEQALLKKTVDDLNSIDDEVAFKFFKKNNLISKDGVLSPAAIELKQIEHAADVTDRVQSEVSPEEFGRKMFPASQNLVGKERKMSAVLEEHYKEITKGLSYSEVYIFNLR